MSGTGGADAKLNKETEMNYIHLNRQLLSQEEQNEMEVSLGLLEKEDYPAFYEKNKDIIRSSLFIEDMEEFLDFSGEDELDRECFSFAFLCAKKHGIQIGGYKDDLTDTLTAFFKEKGLWYPEISEIIGTETIYTDGSDIDNFKNSMEEMNRVLDVHGLQLAVFEDCVYCECEYTILVLDKPLAERISSSWESDNFSVSL